MFHVTIAALKVSANSAMSKKLDLSDVPSIRSLLACRAGWYAGQMRPSFDPFRLVLISIAGWLGQQQRDIIDYLQEEKLSL